MKKILLVSSLCGSLLLSAQMEFSSFTNTGRGCATAFATDYQAVGVNPANLGWNNPYGKKFTMGLSEFTGSVYSDSLRKDDLRSSIFNMISGNSDKLTYDQKVQAARSFTSSGLTLNADLGSFGLAFQMQKIGGFAFRINDHFQWYSKLGQEASDLIFLGKTSSLFDKLTIQLANGSTTTINNHPNLSPDTAKMVVNGYTNTPQLISKILDGSRMSMMWYREYNLSYGRKLLGWDSIIAVYAGVGIKYIQGLAMLDIKSENGQLTGFSSLSPTYGVDYGAAAAQANQVAGSGFPKAVGAGYGADFGATVVIKRRLIVGASLINVGKIDWTGNVYQLKDTLMVSLSVAGVDNLNLFNQMKNMIGPNGMFKVTGQQSYTTQLPGLARAGASILIGKIAHLGVDFVMPTNNTVPGTITNPIIGIGGDIMPVPWLKLQAGFVDGGNTGYQVPVGIVLVAPGGTYEAGIASRDAVTFFTQHGPTISLSTGFVRVRF